VQRCNRYQQVIHTDDTDDATVLGFTVLIGQHIALVHALVGHLNVTDTQSPRELSRSFNAVVDIVLERHVLRQRQNLCRAILQPVRALPAHLLTQAIITLVNVT